MQEQEIREHFDRFASAWNRHDIGAMVDCWAHEGNAIDPWGRFAAGHVAIGELLASEHESSMRDSRYQLRDIRVRPLSADSAIVACEAVIEGVHAPNGTTYDLPHHIDAVVVRQDGCRFLSLHPTFARA
jgi:uncharacterized protein (TIGR02246 family)